MLKIFTVVWEGEIGKEEKIQVFGNITTQELKVAASRISQLPDTAKMKPLNIMNITRDADK